MKPQYKSMKFLNAMLIVESPYTAEEWLSKIKKIEKTLHRVRTEDSHAPRTIDVDIIFAGDRVIDTDLLRVPHARWSERRFVVQPLAEVRPELVLPGTKSPVCKILAGMSNNDDVRLFSEKW